jgi:hypothetical protein
MLRESVTQVECCNDREELKMSNIKLRSDLIQRAFVGAAVFSFGLAFDHPLMSQQAGVGSLIPIAQLGAATQIPKPTLTRHGGPLLLSDSPETLSSTVGLPGLLYRDEVQGRFRVFYHHQNTTPGPLFVGIAITNSTKHFELVLTQGEGQSVNIYPDVAGQSALAEFISSHRHLSFAAILAPGETYWSVQNVTSGDTASAIQQYALISVTSEFFNSAALMDLNHRLELDSNSGDTYESTSLPEGFRWGSAAVMTVAYDGARPSDPTALAVLPPDTHIRGTFAHFDRFGAFKLATQNGLQELSLSTSAPGLPYSDDLPGEYELGTDAVDGGLQVYNDGNYGVLYTLRIAIDKGQPSILPFALLMQPAGGAGHYVEAVNRNLALSPALSTSARSA